MPEGFIMVRTFTSRAEIPLSDVSVAVTLEGQASETLVGVRFTNRNGKTEKISIETPPLEYSKQPFDERPFATCNVRVSYENYYTVFIRDVQVFPDITTLQNVEMIPLKENAPEGERLKTIVVPAQNL